VKADFDCASAPRATGNSGMIALPASTVPSCDSTLRRDVPRASDRVIRSLNESIVSFGMVSFGKALS
jgi:hypothetical protein